MRKTKLKQRSVQSELKPKSTNDDLDVHFVVSLVDRETFSCYKEDRDKVFKEESKFGLHGYYYKSQKGLFQYSLVCKNGKSSKWKKDCRPVNLFEIVNLLEKINSDQYEGDFKNWNPDSDPDKNFSVCVNNRYILCSSISPTLVDEEELGTLETSVALLTLREAERNEDEDDFEDFTTCQRISHDFLYWFEEVERNDYVYSAEDICQKPKFYANKVIRINFLIHEGLIEFVCTRNKKFTVNLLKKKFKHFYMSFARSNDGNIICIISETRLYKELQQEFWNGASADGKYICSSGSDIELD